MAKEAIVRQFFVELLENLGYHVSGYEEYEEEECNMILADLFFAGMLEVKWNPVTESLMLKPKLQSEAKIDSSLVRALSKQ